MSCYLLQAYSIFIVTTKVGWDPKWYSRFTPRAVFHSDVDQVFHMPEDPTSLYIIIYPKSQSHAKLILSLNYRQKKKILSLNHIHICIYMYVIASKGNNESRLEKEMPHMILKMKWWKKWEYSFLFLTSHLHFPTFICLQFLAIHWRCKVGKNQYFKNSRIVLFRC